MKYQNLGDSVYFWFAANDTSGSGNDGAAPVFDVRLAGDTSSAAPVYSGSATLLSHANYPPGAHEIAVPATTGNGFVAGNEYAVFCTLLVDSQNPTGFVGDFKLDAVYADIIEVGGDSQSMIDFKDFVDYGYLPDQHKVYDVYNTDELLAAVLTGTGGDATAANQISILANQTTILSKLLGTIAAGTHIAQSGDGYAILNDGTIGNSALKTILNSISAAVGGDTTITNKNVRICEVVYDSDTYHFAVGVNSLDEINDIVEDWALEKFGILSGGETVLSPALDLPSALVYTKTLSDVITTISDIEDDIYEIST